MCVAPRLGAVPPLLRPPGVERMVWSIALQGRLSALAREALALTMTDSYDDTQAESVPAELTSEPTPETSETSEPPSVAPETSSEASETEKFEPLAARAPVSEDSPLFA